MENLSEYVPLLIIVVSIILSVVNGSKKKKATTHETRIPGIPPAEPQPMIESESWLPEEIDLIDEQVRHVSTPQIKPASFSSKEKKSSIAKPISPEDEISEPFINVSDADEIKKAVIYTEIFKRREY